MGTTGFEHRFYNEAHKYTGLFWPVTSDEVEDSLNRITVYSLNQFKRQAETRKYMIELKNLKSPSSGDVRPQPPVVLE